MRVDVFDDVLVQHTSQARMPAVGRRNPDDVARQSTPVVSRQAVDGVPFRHGRVAAIVANGLPIVRQGPATLNRLAEGESAFASVG